MKSTWKWLATSLIVALCLASCAEEEVLPMKLIPELHSTTPPSNCSLKYTSQTFSSTSAWNANKTFSVNRGEPCNVIIVNSSGNYRGFTIENVSDGGGTSYYVSIPPYTTLNDWFTPTQSSIKIVANFSFNGSVSMSVGVCQ